MLVTFGNSFDPDLDSKPTVAQLEVFFSSVSHEPFSLFHHGVLI